MNQIEELALLRATLNEIQAGLNRAFSQLEMYEKGVKPSLAPVDLPAITFPIALPPPKPAEEPLVINDEWKSVLERLNNGKEHLFVTGGAGTGKSTLLNHFTSNFQGVAAVLAPTGVAALRVGGETIHRFFRFGAHIIQDEDIRVVDYSQRSKYENLDVLVIDEISMVRADLMDAIDKFLRKNRRKPTIPFGGVRLVMIGDLFQLPPVSKDVKEKQYLMNRYGTEDPYFFHAEVWRDEPPKLSTLTTIFRQKDPVFTDTLNAIRQGSLTPEQMKVINNRVNLTFRPPSDEDLWITLTTTNNAADHENRRMIDSLKTELKMFEAQVSGDFDLKNAPTDEWLKLKPGAVVMFNRNNKDGGWSNGTLGKVTSVNPLKVLVNGVEQEVQAETWESIVYEFDPLAKKLTKSVKGKFTQIPLKPAAAITIHKSQGLTFDKMIIDMANGAFAAGQAYVGLSRCRTLDGMVLRRPLKESDLIVSQEVIKFMKGEPIAKPATVVQTSIFDPVKTVGGL